VFGVVDVGDGGCNEAQGIVVGGMHLGTDNGRMGKVN
jgi:hypothetical protein